MKWTMNKTAIILTILVLSLAAFGQAKKPAEDLGMAESVDLTDGKPCGDPRFTKAVSFTGTVVKRQFDESEVRLSGIVLRDRKDQRYYINIDSEYLSDQTGMLSLDLSQRLEEGSYVQIKADMCGRIYLARRMRSLKL